MLELDGQRKRKDVVINGQRYAIQELDGYGCVLQQELDSRGDKNSFENVARGLALYLYKEKEDGTLERVTHEELMRMPLRVIVQLSQICAEAQKEWGLGESEKKL